MRASRTRRITVLGCLLAALPLPSSSNDPVTSTYGRSQVRVDTRHAQPGGVLGVLVSRGRWESANTLLDGRRGALSRDAGGLFGLVPLALDTLPAEHKLSLYFPGGRRRGGATTLLVPVAPISRRGRPRVLSPDALEKAQSQTALGHGRYLLNAIRSRDLPAYQSGPLVAPVEGAISFPFGGLEDYGITVGPIKDGLMGEHHRGVDYDVAVGTPVKSPGSGVILLARSLVFSGETVVIGHGRGLVSVLSHLSHVSVREGDPVSPGSPVGVAGKTGIGALTTHLCFSVYLHSLNVDPEAVMDQDVWLAARSQQTARNPR